MISMIRKPMTLAAMLFAIGLLGKPVRADLTITVQENSGPITTVVSVPGSPTSDLFDAENATTAHYSITLLGGESNQFASNGVLTSELLSSTTSVQRLAGSGAFTLHIVITGTGYTAPTAPPMISTDSQVSGTITQTSSTNTLNYESFVAGVGLGVQSPAITAKQYDSNNPGTLSSLSAPFTIKETIDITLNGQGDALNFTTNTTLKQTIEHTQAVTPEPSTMALAGLGALGLIGYSLRRRKALGA
jgi:hypothetical protein